MKKHYQSRQIDDIVLQFLKKFCFVLEYTYILRNPYLALKKDIALCNLYPVSKKEVV